MVEKDKDFSLKNIFVPVTTSKAIHIIVIVGLVIYLNMLFNGFVWDDLSYIIDNPELHRFNILTLVGPNTFNSSGYFRPVPAIYFSILFNLFGKTAFFYHLSQLILHIICTSLLYLIFQKFFRPATSLVLSLIFLVHPINVESVAYIGATQSQIYLIFGGLALYLVLTDVLKTKKIILIHILLILALLTKEVSVLFFFLIYLYRLLNRKIISVKFILSSLLSIFTYLCIRLAVLGTFLHRMQLIPISQLSLVKRLLHLPIIVFYYLKTFFFPKILAIDQIWTISQLNVYNFYLPLVLIVIFLGVILFSIGYFIHYRKKYTTLLIFFFLWYLSGMSLILQIFPLDMTVADRWFYLPIIGILGMLGIYYEKIIEPLLNRNKAVFVFGLSCILILLSARTIIRNSDWKSPLTLYLHDVKYFDNYDIENFLGAELVSAGRSQEALTHFLKSVSLLPHDTNLYNVGSVYESLKDYNNAKIYYLKTLAEKNNDYGHSEVRKLAYIGLIKMMLIQDKADDVDPWVKNAVKEFPDNGTLWAYLAINDYKLKRQDSASTAAKKAVDLLPNPTTKKMYQRILDNQPIDLRLE